MGQARGRSRKRTAPRVSGGPPYTMTRREPRKVQLPMSVPAPREPGPGGRWETIRYALDTNPRTFRLCLILSVATLAPCMGVVVAELIRHMLLCGAV
jgi:hypothetical protein